MSWTDLHRFVYVLRLQDNCWYVGMCTSSSWRSRWWQHLSGSGSAWTQAHKPICVEEKWEFEGDWRFGELLENKRFIEYALKYGVENVRGGHYCVSENNPKEESLAEDYKRIIKAIESSKFLKCNGWVDIPARQINTVNETS